MRRPTFMVLALVWILVACTQVPHLTQIPSPTLPPTWGPQGIINPTTIQAYIDEVHLEQTTRIELTDPVTHEQVVITSMPTIQAIVKLVSLSPENCTGAQVSIGNEFMFIMYVPGDVDEQVISVDYHPVENEILMDTIATPNYPYHIQGTYSVCPNFGRSLFELLDINASSVEPLVTAQPTISIEYQNTEYGFSFSLPVSWKGYSIITDTWRGYNNGNSDITVEQGPIISIRNPLWTPENPYQDIPIMVFTLSQWNSLQQGEYSVSAGGIYTELGRNAKYVFALYSRYNFVVLPGMEDVKTILDGNPLHTP
jgi:hypothetical protein